MSEPKLINSPLSQKVMVEGHRFEIEIYRSEDTQWYLEVVNAEGTSLVWDIQFPTDKEALSAAMVNFESNPIEDMLG